MVIRKGIDMIVSGRFAKYKGIEYKAAKKSGKIILYSKNEKDIKIGFKYNAMHTTLTLTVDEKDIEKYYSKSTVGKYENEEFYVIDESEEEYVLYSGERSFSLSDMGFSQVAKGEYQKSVSKNLVSEVKVIEEEL